MDAAQPAPAQPAPGRIADEDALRALYGAPSPRAVAKEIDRLDAHCRAFLARSPMLFMGTSDGVRADVSPKGDAPGFVQAEDDRHVLIPDWPGNRRIDGLRNILKNPHVGLICVIPGETWTLRINGPAEIRTDAALRARFETRGKLPITVLRVRADEVFLHCAKAFLRSSLWSPDTWPDAADRPEIGAMLKDHAALDQTPDRGDMDRSLGETLY